MLALEAVPESGPLGARPVRCGAVVCAGARASAACADMPLSRTSLPLATVADLPEQRMAAHPRAHHPNQFVRPLLRRIGCSQMCMTGFMCCQHHYWYARSKLAALMRRRKQSACRQGMRERQHGRQSTNAGVIHNARMHGRHRPLT